MDLSSQLPADTIKREEAFKNATIGKHGARGAINQKAESAAKPQEAIGYAPDTMEAKIAAIEQDVQNLLLKVQALKRP